MACNALFNGLQLFASLAKKYKLQEKDYAFCAEFENTGELILAFWGNTYRNYIKEYGIRYSHKEIHRSEFLISALLRSSVIAALTRPRRVIHHRSLQVLRCISGNKKDHRVVVFFIGRGDQFRTVCLIFLKSIHGFQSADRLIPWR